MLQGVGRFLVMTCPGGLDGFFRMLADQTVPEISDPRRTPRPRRATASLGSPEPASRQALHWRTLAQSRFHLRRRVVSAKAARGLHRGSLAASAGHDHQRTLIGCQAGLPSPIWLCVSLVTPVPSAFMT